MESTLLIKFFTFLPTTLSNQALPGERITCKITIVDMSCQLCQAFVFRRNNREEMERTLLLVDDEENILSSLARLFRRDGYRILRANSGAGGLEILANNAVNVIISDQRMPEMTGTQFLCRVKELYPDTIRMVLSGYTELESITDAINQGAIYKFLTKPWDDDQLRANVQEAFRDFELRMENGRASDNLSAANNELMNLNHDLEKRYDEKNREAQFGLRALQISQKVLEELPVAVLGIGGDKVIVVANRAAHEMFGNGIGLVGQLSDDVFPASIHGLYRDASEQTTSVSCVTQLEEEHHVEVHCSPFLHACQAGGVILVMIPRKHERNHDQ
ncbi:MAG: response regulator [Gammaproteobacteria bacterium]